MNKQKHWDKVNLWICLAFSLFFIGLFLFGEPQYLGDTYQHENQFVSREPVYALLIQLLKWIFPTAHFRVLIGIQSILAIWANSMFLIFLRKGFELKNWMLPFAGLIMLAPHIVTPFASSTHMVITNSLLSEGLTYSLYLYVIKYLLLTLQSKKALGKESLIALFSSLFVSCTRGQFMIFLVLWLLTAGLTAIIGRQKKQLLIIFLAFVVTFVGRGYLIKIYNYSEQGLFVGTVAGKSMQFANVLYVADKEDGDSIQDTKLRELFYQMYDAADKDQMNYKYAPDGLMQRAIHHEECHDALNFDYFQAVAAEYIASEKGVTTGDYQKYLVVQDEVATELMNELLPSMVGKYLYNYVTMIMMGLVRSVAIVHPVLNWYALFVYLIAVMVMVYVWYKDHYAKSAYFMLLTLIMIAGNVAGTALMIQCISRYMLYSLPLFYIALALLLRDVFMYNKQSK